MIELSLYALGLAIACAVGGLMVLVRNWLRRRQEDTTRHHD